MLHIADKQSSELFSEYIIDEEYWNDDRTRNLQNNRDTFDFDTFADKSFSMLLSKRNRIYRKEKTGGYMEFIIDNHGQALEQNGSRGMRIYSTASYLELKKSKPINPKTLENQSPSSATGIALNGTGWTPGRIEGKGSRKFIIEEHTNSYDFLKRIAKEFGLELLFRVVIEGNEVVGRYVDLLERVGTFRGYEATLGHNLLGIERKEKTTDIVTALLGVSPADTDGKRKSALVTNVDALKRWGRIDEQGNLKHLYDVYYPESSSSDMTLGELKTYTENELEKRVNARYEYITNIAVLNKEVGQEIHFGDTINVKDEGFFPALYLQARVHTMSEKNKGKKVEVTLGDYVEYTEAEVNSIYRSLQKQIATKIDAAKLMEYAEPKKIESPTPPPIEGNENTIWVDTSKKPFIPHVPNFGEWQKMSPTKAIEIGAETPEGAQAKVDAVEIGGRNLLLNTDFHNGLEGWLGWGTTSTDLLAEDAIFPAGIRAYTADGLAGQVGVHTPTFRMNAGKTYTVSFWFRSMYNSGFDLDYLYLRNHSNGTMETIKSLPNIDLRKVDEVNGLSSVWNVSFEVSHDITLDNASLLIAFQTNGTADQGCAIYYPQVEEGNKQTSWGLAQEDSTNDASRLMKGIIDVGSVPLRTSVTGARIIWDGVNGFVQYDRDGNPVAWFDLNGNARFAGDLSGASGTFGNVTAVDGNFFMEESATGLKYEIAGKNNLVKDHSFELVKGDPDSFDANSVQYNWLEMAPNDQQLRSYWRKIGSPKVATIFRVGMPAAMPLYGEQAIIVRSSNFVEQIIGAESGITANNTYTLSASFKRSWNQTAGGTPALTVWHVDEVGAEITRLGIQTFDPVPSDYTKVRHSITFTTPNDFLDLHSLKIVIWGGNSEWVQCDGVELVEGAFPSNYNPEDSTWRLANGYYNIKGKGNVLWAGSVYLTNTANVVPSKRISDCNHGWVLEWSRTGSNVAYAYTLIPKQAIATGSNSQHHVMTESLSDTSIGLTAKVVFAHDDHLTGSGWNNSGHAASVQLRSVYEY